MVKDISQKHFDSISRKYQRAADSWQELYEQIEARIDSLVKDKVVLDIGNGGRFAYDTSLPRQVMAMDIAPSMLDRIQDPKIVKVVGDARDMETIDDESLDIIIFLFVLHHINGANVRESLETLTEVLSSSRCKLRPGGRLIVAESLLSPLLFRIQCFLFPLTKFFLGRFGVSPIFFFSLPLLAKAISQNFRLAANEIEVQNLQLEEWVDPLGGSFPGLIQIPAWLHPLKFRLAIATKPKKIFT